MYDFTVFLSNSLPFGLQETNEEKEKQWNILNLNAQNNDPSNKVCCSIKLIYGQVLRNLIKTLITVGPHQGDTCIRRNGCE